ncbi:MAG: VWA domain-containing protein [Kofleriaceae bacterium]|nr:VWA domain-containing protein [Kofleriaceae bacterium]
MRWKTLLLGLISSIGCGGHYGGDFGATPGGVKDLTLARELIAAGKVPPADALLVEAMFSEHDLALEGAPCASTLCLRAAAGFAPEHDEAPRGFAQVGLSSTIDPATWQRPSTTFIFTVDVSGSMGWGSDVSPGELSRSLLHKLTDELREDDRVAIVTYGSDIETKLALTSGAQRARVHDAIDDLSEDGSTNMEDGMRRAYTLGDDAVGSTEQVRVIVFTDVQPNVGATGASEFNTLVSDAATHDVHTTVLALGTGIGPEVMRAMASLRGANAFSMTDDEDVEDFIADEYPWFTTPIAYGLRVNVQLENGWSIDRGLGFPAASDEEQIGLKAETVFLSKRKGALLAAFTPPAETTTPAGLAGAFDLAYTERDGTEVHTTAPFAYDDSAIDARGHWFAQHGVARTTALGLLTEAMHDAAVVYSANPEAAEEIMRTAHTRYTADAEALGDADLAVEADLSGALLQLIVDRAAQGTLYGL